MKKLKYFILTKTIGLYINLLSNVNPKKAAQLAYELFSEPREGKLSPEHLPKILQKAEKATFLHKENQYQTYTWKGNNHIILLVHGWESNASRWEKLLPYLLKTGSTIMAIDAPAHGLSDGKEFNVPKYADCIDAFSKIYNPNVLIGHSIGGAACIYYQFLNQNKNIDKMVLLGSPSDLRNLIQNYCAMLSLNTKVQRYLDPIFIKKTSREIEEFSAKKFASQITTTALIAHDIDDTVVSFEEGKKIASTWKNCTFIETKGLGNIMHDDDLYIKVADFLFEAD